MRIGTSAVVIVIAAITTFAVLKRVTGTDLATVAILLTVTAVGGLLATWVSARRRTDVAQYDNGTTLMSPYDVERSF